MRRYLAFPYAIAPSGRTLTADPAAHMRDLLEQIVFVEPGERVNRPGFGCVLQSLTFTTGRDEIAAAMSALVHGALRQWSNHAIHIRDVAIEPDGPRVTVTITYTDIATQEIHRVTVSR